MPVTVRRMRPSDARTFLDIHGRAIRGLAAAHYARDVIDAWVVPPTPDNLRDVRANEEREIRLIAELDDTPVGIGALVVETSELRACYVVPEAARCGVGTAIVGEIERLAIAHALDRLELVASLNAEPFYRALGYEAHGRTEITLRGQPMTAIRMSKRLAGQHAPVS